MRQAFAIPIVDEISNIDSEKEAGYKENDNNNCVEENIEIKSIETKDLDSLFSLQDLRGA